MISVIVPVYNVEKYLCRCVESILNQTYKDIELILVDDGSSDQSPRICDDYEKKDSRVKVIHKKNGGLSDARNVGMGSAGGDHLIFVDSDDWIRKDTIELLSFAADRYEAEVSIGRFMAVYEDGEMPDMSAKVANNRCLDGREALKELLYGRLFGTTACGFLIKTELAKKYPFPVGRYHEDDFTTFNYYLSCNTVAVTDADLYYYFQRSGSIMHSEKTEVIIDRLDAADHIREKCGKEGEALEKAGAYSRFFSYCQVLSEQKELKKSAPDIYSRILSGIKEEAPMIAKDKDSGKRMKIYAFCFRVGGVPFLRAVSHV